MAPPGPNGAATAPAATGRITCPSRFPMSRTASAEPRHVPGTAVEIRVIVRGWPRPRKNPPTARKRAAHQKLSRNSGGTISASPEASRLAISSARRENLPDSSGSSRRDAIDASPRAPRSTPTTEGATPASSPTSGRNAVRMSIMASRDRDATMLDMTPGARRMRSTSGRSSARGARLAALGASSPPDGAAGDPPVAPSGVEPPAPDATPVPGVPDADAEVSGTEVPWGVGSAAASSSGGAPAPGRREAGPRRKASSGAAATVTSTPIHRLSFTAARRSGEATSEPWPTIHPPSAGPIIWPAENAAVNHPKPLSRSLSWA